MDFWLFWMTFINCLFEVITNLKFYKRCVIKDNLYTINKLRSLNLHFSSMFCIERKVVHVGEEKIITLYLYQVSVKFENFSFTFNDAEDYARDEMWQKVCTTF